METYAKQFVIFLNYISRLSILISSTIFGYIVFLLISNSSRGFDTSDDSYYILGALYPNEIFSVITHDSYYTGLLYWISGYNLSYFRSLGIVLLIFVSAWFAIELHRYISKKFDYTTNIWDKFLFIIPISSAGLSYYQWWLLTPSYNWLALVGVALVFISLFRIISNKEQEYNKYITMNYVLLSFSLSLTFMAKPTTALVIVIISFLFAIYEFKNINLKKALPSVIILTSIIVIGHIIILDGGLSSYFDRLFETLEREAVSGMNHTITNIFINMIEDIILKFFFNNYNLYSVIFIITLLFLARNKMKSLNIYFIIMLAILLVYTFFTFVDFGNRLIWLRSINLLLLNLVLIIMGLQLMKEKKAYLSQIKRIVPILFIIILGSFAYAFGTNNYIIYQMSGSMLFLASSIIILNYIFDKISNTSIFTALAGLIISMISFFSIHHAYEQPFRLNTSIKGQNQKVAFLGGLNVDAQQKKYIEDLQVIAGKHKKEYEKISLIDMTGGSPGANVILNARFFDKAWLLGGYSGSNLFVERILKAHQGTNRLKKAWILIAPKGKIKLNLNILNKIGLDFPKNYKKIGTVKIPFRNEIQELWIPNLATLIREK